MNNIKEMKMKMNNIKEMNLKMAQDQKKKKKFEKICVLNTFDNNEINDDDFQTNT